LPISLYLIWFLIGVGFLIGEMMVPGFILVFFAAGSWVVAISVFFLENLALTTQIIIIFGFTFYPASLRVKNIQRTD